MPRYLAHFLFGMSLPNAVEMLGFFMCSKGYELTFRYIYCQYVTCVPLSILQYLHIIHWWHLCLIYKPKYHLQTVLYYSSSAPR